MMNVLNRKPEVKITPDLTKYFVGRQIEAYQVIGDCMEARKIPDKGILFFDLEMRPSIGDVTICRLEGCPDPLAKMLYGPSARVRGTYLVGTCYKDRSRDHTFLVSSVQGIAVACFDETGSLIWRRPTQEEIEKNHLDINTREGWNRACKESAARMLRMKGIEPTEENIAQYQKDLKRNTDKMIDEWLAKEAALKQKKAA